MDLRLTLQLGDIVSAKVDAIVISARGNLVEGGPLHAAVHAAAGPELLAECEKLAPCPPGEVRISGGHRLPFAYILHTVPPTWMGGDRNERQVLASCYRKALELARDLGMKSIAFPSLGSGKQPQIPLDVGASIAVGSILDFLAQNDLPEKVVMVCFDGATYQAHQKVLKEAPQPNPRGTA